MNSGINFDKSPDGLVPAVIQDAQTGKVLMLGYMNREAHAQTIADNRVTFFSRSKERLWTKGETSGNFLNVQEIRVDCDGDTLLIKANPAGPVCHTGADTCFDEVNQAKASPDGINPDRVNPDRVSPDRAHFLNYLQGIIHDRKVNPSATSYTTTLFNRGINKIAQKVGEEAVELVIEAKDTNDELFKGEAADLLFHFLVLLEHKNIDLNDIVAVLQSRHTEAAR